MYCLSLRPEEKSRKTQAKRTETYINEMKRENDRNVSEFKLTETQRRRYSRLM